MRAAGWTVQTETLADRLRVGRRERQTGAAVPVVRRGWSR
jgi:hypothetical protein